MKSPGKVRIVGFLLVLASLFSVVQSWLTTRDQNRYAECQAQWSQDLAVYISVNKDISAEERASMDVMIQGVFVATDRTQSLNAIRDYLESRKQREQERLENPPPSFPETICH